MSSEELRGGQGTRLREAVVDHGLGHRFLGDRSGSLGEPGHAASVQLVVDDCDERLILVDQDHGESLAKKLGDFWQHNATDYRQSASRRRKNLTRASISRADFHVVVQTIPAREASLESTLEALNESDVGTYQVVCQRAEEGRLDTLRATLLALHESGAPFGVRLEDDALVSRFLIANLLAWPALSDPDFGGGWLFSSFLSSLQHGFVERAPNGEHYRIPDRTVGGVGCVLSRAQIGACLADLDALWSRSGEAQDVTLSLGIAAAGKRLYMHEPPLVEHNVAFASTLAPDRPVDPGLHTSGGRFDRDWRRT